LFSPTRKQQNNKESLATDLLERLNLEQSFFKTVFLTNSFFQYLIKNNLCRVSRRRVRDRDRNPSRPRRDLRDRDSKKRVSRHVSRPRPSLETPSLISSVSAPF